MNSAPMVSVLMTSYNREQFIAEAIESVLNSDFRDFELLIVDDASTDNTLEVARRYAARDKRIRIFINPNNLGQFANRNRAAALAEGRYLKYLDSDDKILPHALSIMVAALERYPTCGLAIEFRNCAPVPTSGFPFLLTPQEAYLWHFEKGGLLFVSPSQVLIRRSAFEKSGGFDESWHSNADVDLVLRLAANSDTIVLEPGLVYWRRHQHQVASQQERDAPEMMAERLKMHRALIMHASCPLTSRQKEKILFANDVIYLRAAVFRHFFQYGYRSFCRLFSGDTVRFYKLPILFVPLRLVRKL